MSSFQKDIFRRKLQQRESELGFNPEAEEGDSLPPLGSMGPPRRRRRTTQIRPWSDYFEENFVIGVPGRGEFNVYFIPPKDLNSPMFVLQHGAGSSALTYAVLASRIKALMERDAQAASRIPSSRDDTHVGGVMAFDMRGHGLTHTDNDADFALETLTTDLIEVINAVWRLKGYLEKPPPLIIVGHSLGGSIVADAASRRVLPRLIGVVVMDVVEGPTLESLAHMTKLLDSWPSSFPTIEESIEWHLSRSILHNRESAAVSVPGALKPVSAAKGAGYTWSIDLRKTEPYWQDWFKGLSARFLEAPAARMLILAGTDRLDKELTIGQMQGKYQLLVFNEAGHFVHEDEPDKTALSLIDFWVRNGRPTKIIPAFGKFRDA
ncbi:protein phosphatase methylesterase 1 [Trichomonascus vanleenenianus]|uniref:phosphoprotein phosphatase methylesterase 1 n=1 Tax=Trichomonascus vanleenenianus TaxID=2268995 RepID=UPI003ECA4657